MTSITELVDELSEVARKLRDRRAELDNLGHEWQTERSTMLGRIEVLEQTIAASGVQELSSINPLVVAAHAFAIKTFGNVDQKRGYLRARGWRWSNAQYDFWAHPTYGEWNMPSALDGQVNRDIAPLKRLAGDPTPMTSDHPIEQPTATADVAIAEPVERVDYIPFMEAGERFRDATTGEILATPGQLAV